MGKKLVSKLNAMLLNGVMYPYLSKNIFTLENCIYIYIYIYIYAS